MTTDDIAVPSWARSTVWLVAANVLRNLGLLAILVALAQLTDPTVVGRYALALALTSPIFVLAQLGLKGVYLTLRTHSRFSSFLLVQLGSVLAAFGVCIVLALAVNRGLVSTVALVCFVKAVDCGFELGSGALQLYHRTPIVFWSYLAAAVLGVGAVVAILLATGDLDLALLGLGVVNAAVALTTALRRGWVLARSNEAQLPSSSRRTELFRILAAGLPAGIGTAMLALVASMPQYFLAASWGESAVGYFAVLLYLVAIADIFGGTLTQTWIPSARARLAKGQQGFLLFSLAVAARWTLAFIPLVAVGLWLGSIVLPLAMSPEYQIGWDLVLPLAAAMLLLPLLHFEGMAISVLNLYIHTITVSVATAIVAVISCVVLVPTYGLAGALWATAFAFLARGLAAVTVLVTRGRRDIPTTRSRPPGAPQSTPL